MRQETYWRNEPPAIKREDEISRATHVLMQRYKNSVVFVGPPGIGKTAVLFTIIRRIMEGQIPQFKNKPLLYLDMKKFQADLTPGALESRLIELQNYIRFIQGQPIIFLDEIQILFNLSSISGKLVDHLKEDLGSDRLTLVGATTDTDYRTSIRRDSALNRRINEVVLPELSGEDTLRILESTNSSREQYYSAMASKTLITPMAVLKEAVRLSKEYIKDKHFPDKALDVIRRACSVRVAAISDAKNKLKALEDDIRIQFEKALRAMSGNEVGAEVEAKGEIVSLIAEYYSLQERLAGLEGEKAIEIEISDLFIAVSDMTGIPLQKLQEDEAEKLLKMEAILSERVIGQDQAKKVLSDAVRTGRTVKRPGKPQGVFLFAGPTGVGKTEIAKTLTAALHGDDSFLVRVDMSEYTEPHSVAKLIGSPPGYVGSERGGGLTEAVRKKPYSIVLFDELEKAHPEVLKVMLQIFDDARLTDGRGKTADFSNTIIIMTSNLAAIEIRQAIAKIEEADEAARVREGLFGEALKAAFAPEFIGRVDEIVHFEVLSEENIRAILELQLASVKKQFAEKSFQLEFAQEAKDLLIKKGYNPEYGARPLEQAIKKLIINPLAAALISQSMRPQSIIQVGREEDGLVFKVIGEIEKPTFQAPQIEGRVGVQVLRMLALLEQKASERTIQITPDEIEELLFPREEKVRSALNAVVEAGELPSGNVRLQDNDFKRKDPAVMDVVKQLRRLAVLAGFDENVGQIAGEFIYQVSNYAKQSNVQRTPVGEPPYLSWNFDGENFQVTVRTPMIPVKSTLRKKIVDNLIAPNPTTQEEAQAVFEGLAAEGDLNLIELKRKALAEKGLVVFDDKNRETIFVLRFKLFPEEKKKPEEEKARLPQPGTPEFQADLAAAETAATAGRPPKVPVPATVSDAAIATGRASSPVTETQDLAPSASPTAPRRGTGEITRIPDNIVALLTSLTKGTLDLQAEKDLISLIKGKSGLGMVFRGLSNIAIDSGKDFAVKLQALRVYVAVRGAARSQATIGKFLDGVEGDSSVRSLLGAILEGESRLLSSAVIRAILENYSGKYRQYLEVFVDLMSKDEQSRFLFVSWYWSRPKSEREEIISRFFKSPAKSAPFLNIRPKHYYPGDLETEEIWLKPEKGEAQELLAADWSRVARKATKLAALEQVMRLLAYRVDARGFALRFEENEIKAASMKIKDFANKIRAGSETLILDYLTGLIKAFAESGEIEQSSRSFLTNLFDGLAQSLRIALGPKAEEIYDSVLAEIEEAKQAYSEAAKMRAFLGTLAGKVKFHKKKSKTM